MLIKIEKFLLEILVKFSVEKSRQTASKTVNAPCRNEKSVLQ